MIKFTCCPKFTVRSFIFFITVIDILVYITTVVVSFTGSYKGLEPSAFLGPNSEVIKDFGGQVPYLIKCEG